LAGRAAQIISVDHVSAKQLKLILKKNRWLQLETNAFEQRFYA